MFAMAMPNLPIFTPMPLVRRAEPFDDHRWLSELKFDRACDLDRFLNMPDHVREQVLNVMRYEGEIPTHAETVGWMTRAERREEASRRGLAVVRK
jgi:hypothetical protein